MFLLALGVLLSACTDVTLSSTFLEDGSARHVLSIVIDEDALPPDQVSRVRNRIQRTAERAEEDGYETEVVDAGDEIGIRVTDVSVDATNVPLELNSMFNSLVNPGDSPAAPFEGTFQRESEAIGGNLFRLALDVDGTEIGDAIEEVIPAGLDQVDETDIRHSVSLEYHATMPGEIQDTNGATRSADSVSWEIPLNDMTSVLVESAAAQDTPWFWVGATVAAALLVVIGTAGVVYAVLVRQRREGQLSVPGTDGAREERAHSAALRETESPDTLSEVGSSLGRIVDDVMSGNLTNERAVQPHLEDEAERGSRRGSDSERD